MSLTTAAAKRYVQSLHTLGRQSFCDGRGAEGHQTRGLGESTTGVERGAEGVTSELVLLGSSEVTDALGAQRTVLELLIPLAGVLVFVLRNCSIIEHRALGTPGVRPISKL